MRTMEITKTIRALDSEAYRAFRSKAVELGYTTGAAMSEAMRFWMNAKSRPRVTVRADVDNASIAAEPVASS